MTLPSNQLLAYRFGPDSALEGETGGALRAVAANLEPGTAIAAVLVEHTWARALEDAIARTGGTHVVAEAVDASRITDVLPLLHAAAGGSGS
jgi:hypothetical protein